MKLHTVDFEPVGQKGQCQEDESLLDCAHRLGIGVSSVCGGRGTCKTCRVKVISGALSEPTSIELEALSAQELGGGWRLACQATPASDCRVMLPAESMSTSQRIHVEGLEVTVPPEPAVKAYHLQLNAPSLSDQQADADRLLEALYEQYQLHCRKIDINVLRSLSPQIRDWNWECQVSVCDDEVVALGPWPNRQLGLAVDLGTTTIAGYLVDLSSGQTLAAEGFMNPQISYGEDIISRINRVIKSPQEGIRLQECVVEKLNELAASLCSEANASIDSIVEAVVVGNTAMHHLLLGLSVKQLALIPFTASTGLTLDIKACELGINIASGAYVHFPAIITGFVGSDHAAMLLATDSYQTEGLTVFLDIGTNTEISLVNGDEITTTSCASGPAFEGGHIKHGMHAARGAIERLRITKDTIDYQTIDDAPPVGICGSGVLDAISQLYLAGIIENSGRFMPDHPRIRITDNQTEFLLVDQEEEDGQSTIVITQKDIRELQLAKAAIRTGIQLLLETNGFTEEQLGQVVIAGSFGSYIDVSSAVTVGLLPPLPLNCFRQVGNAAGMGAKLVLVSLSKCDEARDIVTRTRYMELASNPDFKKMFIETSHVGKYWLRHNKREMLENG
ncbi:MAG: DUF4445 domain-containing protein [Dehalococcoidales bacterium]|nr:MAG: DUF4445 domain-containing protein [Dehalococcoidales bacterium]